MVNHIGLHAAFFPQRNNVAGYTCNAYMWWLLQIIFSAGHREYCFARGNGWAVDAGNFSLLDVVSLQAHKLAPVLVGNQIVFVGNYVWTDLHGRDQEAQAKSKPLARGFRSAEQWREAPPFFRLGCRHARVTEESYRQ